MKRHELEHLIRAAGAITGADEIIVIGSQAILGAWPDSPESLLRSCEADLFTLRDPQDADLIDGSIGEGSPFHETFGYYAQGVWLDTATLPDGWRGRLVEIRNDNTRQVTALCLDPHDLAVSKLVAGREKDLDFLTEMARHDMLDPITVESRIAALPGEAADPTSLLARWLRIRMAADPPTRK
ncbi:MAG: hypothetical protein K9N23_09450 [Akkermansiaceae bacterium]|nr:hypothetical protein [Akkermansiaceae bacterium]MCF7731903.1 hypothetical protein [Akkermansiaceae bacterium]